MEAKFTVGQTVKQTAFVDCFGKLISEFVGTVESVRLIENQYIADYYRYKVIDPKQPAHFVEAAERFFVSA